MSSLKIIFGLFVILVLNGCIQSTALLGPGITVVSTGNIFQAGMQYGANTAIKNETGKDALTHVKEVVEKDRKKRQFKKDFKELVEKRVLLARKKISVN
jgi:hypothetical protein